MCQQQASTIHLTLSIRLPLPILGKEEARQTKKTPEAPEVYQGNFQTRRNEGRLPTASPHSFSFEISLSGLLVLPVSSLSSLLRLLPYLPLSLHPSTPPLPASTNNQERTPRNNKWGWETANSLPSFRVASCFPFLIVDTCGGFSPYPSLSLPCLLSLPPSLSPAISLSVSASFSNVPSGGAGSLTD